jgi:hypothetical protein
MEILWEYYENSIIEIRQRRLFDKDFSQGSEETSSNPVIKNVMCPFTCGDMLEKH